MAIEPYVLELDPPPDPWETARRFAHCNHLLFLDSAGGPAELARYSYVAADWSEDLRVLRYRGRDGDDPFSLIKHALEGQRPDTVVGLPPFQGGVAGLFGYDLCHYLERLPRPRLAGHDVFATPDLALGLFDWVIAWDHLAGRAWIVAHGWVHPCDDESIVERGRRAKEEAEWVLEHLELPAFEPVPVPIKQPGFNPPDHFRLQGHPEVLSNFDRNGFEAAVRRTVEYTHAGDCFQVNLAQRLITRLREHPLELYGRLRLVNPAPFAAYFDGGDFQIMSASPERFLKMSHDGQIETRPIKGTRSRGYTPEHDAALHGDLLVSAKDRAENVMIVDLLRNDLGRVCEYGSVKVEALCRLESYPTVHHLVSEVRGQLRPGLTAIDLLKAAFPGGSVTGAPKVRAMEIIAELEPHARGPYCGCLGWIGFDGAMDTNILIRTFTAAGGWLQFPVGGGIVADSDPQLEYEETLHKAAGLLRALEPS